LVKYSGYREEHQWYIDPKLIEVDIVANPGLISYHNTQIDEYDYGNRSREKSRYSQSATEPTIEQADNEKYHTRQETNIRIEPYFFEKYIDGSE